MDEEYLLLLLQMKQQDCGNMDKAENELVSNNQSQVSSHATDAFSFRSSMCVIDNEVECEVMKIEKKWGNSLSDTCEDDLIDYNADFSCDDSNSDESCYDSDS